MNKHTKMIALLNPSGAHSSVQSKSNSNSDDDRKLSLTGSREDLRRAQFLEKLQMFEKGKTSEDRNKRESDGFVASMKEQFSPKAQPVSKFSTLPRESTKNINAIKATLDYSLSPKPVGPPKNAPKYRLQSSPVENISTTNQISKDSTITKRPNKSFGNSTFYESYIDDDDDDHNEPPDYEEIIPHPEDEASSPPIYDDVFEETAPEENLYENSEVSMLDAAETIEDHSVDEESRNLHEKKVKDLIRELIDTETRYIDDMRHVIVDYLPAWRQRWQDSEGVLPTVGEVFMNVEEIHDFHADVLLPKLRDHDDDVQKVAAVFVAHRSKFTMYIQFWKNHPISTRIIDEHKHFFGAIQKDLKRNLDLASYMLAPVQRLPRYKLFMDSLLKCYRKFVTDDADEEESSRLTSLIKYLELASNCIENVLRTSPDIIAMSTIVDFPLDDFLNKTQKHIVTPLTWQDLIFYHDNKQLVKQNELRVTFGAAEKPTTMSCFLFDKMLLFTTISKKKNELRFYNAIELYKIGITHKQNDDKIDIWIDKISNKFCTLHADPPTIKEWAEHLSTLLWQFAKRVREEQQRSVGSAATSSQNAYY